MKLPKSKLVYDRRHKASSVKSGSVDFVVTHNYKQKYISTGLSVLPQHWNGKLSKVVRREDAVFLNEQLQAFVNRAEQILSDMVKKGSVNLDMFVMMMQNKVSCDTTFEEYVRSRAEAKAVKESTRKRYDVFLSTLGKYREHIYFEEIDVRFVRDYDEWLHGKGYEQSTVWTYHKYMKQFVADAIVDGYMESNPYHDKSIRIDKGEKEQVDCLSGEQLQMIADLPLETPFLARARDIFIFMAFSGMSYSDAMLFDLKNAEKEDGVYIYRSERVKTGVGFTVLLLPEALGVIDRYGGRLPRITNQKLNQYLKIIGMMVGEPGLHCHQARGTFATMALDRGVPIDVLKRMLGHKKPMQSFRYASVLNGTVVREMQKMG